MQDFTVSVKKLTDVELMREACEMTFLGKSKQSLLSIYKSEHSPARTQMFWVTLENIPLFVSTHLLRHHVGSQPYQLTCRTDREGGNPGLPVKMDELKETLCNLMEHFRNGGAYTAEEHKKMDGMLEQMDWLKYNADRYTPVNLGLCLNAQSLMDMAKLRLCSQASPETRQVFEAIRSKISLVDPDLAQMMVRKCVYRNGLCGEPRCCGFNSSLLFKSELQHYLNNFSIKQQGKTVV